MISPRLLSQGEGLSILMRINVKKIIKKTFKSNRDKLEKQLLDDEKQEY